MAVHRRVALPPLRGASGSGRTDCSSGAQGQLASKETELQGQLQAMLADFEAYRKQRSEEVSLLSARLAALLHADATSSDGAAAMTACSGALSESRPARMPPAAGARPGRPRLVRKPLAHKKAAGSEQVRLKAARRQRAWNSPPLSHPAPRALRGGGVAARGFGARGWSAASSQADHEGADAPTRMALAIKTDEVLSLKRALSAEGAMCATTRSKLEETTEELSRARARVRDLRAQLAQRSMDRTAARAAEHASDCEARAADAERGISALQSQLSKAKADCRHKSELLKVLQVRAARPSCCEHVSMAAASTVMRNAAGDSPFPKPPSLTA